MKLVRNKRDAEDVGSTHVGSVKLIGNIIIGRPE
jgi:hypothetical protein